MLSFNRLDLEIPHLTIKGRQDISLLSNISKVSQGLKGRIDEWVAGLVLSSLMNNFLREFRWLIDDGFICFMAMAAYSKGRLSAAIASSSGLRALIRWTREFHFTDLYISA